MVPGERCFVKTLPQTDLISVFLNLVGCTRFSYDIEQLLYGFSVGSTQFFQIKKKGQEPKSCTFFIYVCVNKASNYQNSNCC